MGVTWISVQWWLHLLSCLIRKLDFWNSARATIKSFFSATPFPQVTQAGQTAVSGKSPGSSKPPRTVKTAELLSRLLLLWLWIFYRQVCVSLFPKRHKSLLELKLKANRLSADVKATFQLWLLNSAPTFWLLSLIWWLNIFRNVLEVHSWQYVIILPCSKIRKHGVKYSPFSWCSRSCCVHLICPIIILCLFLLSNVSMI